ncbi:hypothetical protein GLAREA_03576 [Glarea lozoyensis ATCC 20868]|uniref:Uncharacterized protein n=1 Tax=Glarea lozoyensis (strain ATCC 20868 / MF5171) TaxID=1116229 RepID=S3D0B3_GLAL2|nr:uncharacterized protein GLAREA_03576 [Glarea lozoyensis ATCC 20868]EPE30609.1 hypothetical protein GLAREA_03576 [Glarea lozoyensis ATCC 20868]
MSAYEKLSTADSETSNSDTESLDKLILYRRHSWKQRLLDACILTLSFTSILIGALTLFKTTHLINSINTFTSQPLPQLQIQPLNRQDPSEVPQNCGSSITEALAKNCIFNIYANAWLPPQCFDQEAYDKWIDPKNDLVEFGHAGKFEWWEDKNHTRPIDQKELGRLKGAHTVQAYHVAHCLFDWDATVKAMKKVVGGESPVWVHSKLLESHHVGHCLMVIASQKHFYQFEWASVAEVTFGFGECVRLDAMGKIEAVFDKVRRVTMDSPDLTESVVVLEN